MKQKTLCTGQEIVFGIDIITDSIAAKAEEESAAILKKAEAEAAAILAGYEEKARALLLVAEEKAKKESEIAHGRAVSAAANHKRNALLFEKGALVEKAFERALSALESLEEEDYFKLLLGLLLQALASEKKGGKLSLAMAKRDLFHGKALVRAVAEEYSVTLAAEDETIGSGFVLMAGDISIDASFATLINLQKASLFGDIYRILFA